MTASRRASWGVLLAVALGVLAAWPAAADPAPDDPGHDCAALDLAEPPDSDLPTPAQRKALKGCDAEALYYGIGQPADPVRGRLCAFTEPETPQYHPFSGNYLLMTIYANGVGARRNLPYAERLACQLRESQRLVELMHLGKRRNFSWCDEQPDNLSSNYCAVHDERIAIWKWQQQLNALALTWSPRVRAAFAALRVAQWAWTGARSRNEVDPEVLVGGR